MNYTTIFMACRTPYDTTNAKIFYNEKDAVDYVLQNANKLEWVEKSKVAIPLRVLSSVDVFSLCHNIYHSIDYMYSGKYVDKNGNYIIIKERTNKYRENYIADVSNGKGVIIDKDNKVLVEIDGNLYGLLLQKTNKDIKKEFIAYKYNNGVFDTENTIKYKMEG